VPLEDYNFAADKTPFAFNEGYSSLDRTGCKNFLYLVLFFGAPIPRSLFSRY